MKPPYLETSRLKLRGEVNEKGFPSFAVSLKDGGQNVGTVGISYPGHWPSPELSWEIRAEHQGNGYATEAAAIVLDFTMETMALKRVIAICEPDNAASERVMQKLGMRLTDTSVCVLRGIPIKLYDMKAQA